MANKNLLYIEMFALSTSERKKQQILKFNAMMSFFVNCDEIRYKSYSIKKRNLMPCTRKNMQK